MSAARTGVTDPTHLCQSRSVTCLDKSYGVKEMEISGHFVNLEFHNLANPMKADNTPVKRGRAGNDIERSNITGREPDRSTGDDDYIDMSRGAYYCVARMSDDEEHVYVSPKL